MRASFTSGGNIPYRFRTVPPFTAKVPPVKTTTYSLVFDGPFESTDFGVLTAPVRSDVFGERLLPVERGERTELTNVSLIMTKPRVIVGQFRLMQHGKSLAASQYANVRTTSDTSNAFAEMLHA